MQSFVIEYQVQLAYVLKQSIQGFDKDLHEVKKCEGRLGRGADENEVEGGVMPVGDQGWGVAGRGGRGRGGGGEKGGEREEIAGAGRAIGDKREDFGDEALLRARILESALVLAIENHLGMVRYLRDACRI